MKLTILISDLQLPLHHRRATAALCNMLADRERDIDEVFQIGDFYDFEAISHWVKGTLKEDGREFQRELDKSVNVLADFHSAYPKPKKRIRGNHDDRLDKYLTGTAKGLATLRALEFDKITDADTYGWVTVPQPYRLAPNTLAVHGLAVRSKSGYTAHAHLDKLTGNAVHGHTHRAGLVYRTTSHPGQTRWAMEIGCLMDFTRAEYLEAGVADWQLAFGALYQEGNVVTPQLIPIASNGSFIFDGKRYTA
jgi:hypothetical protein